MKTRIISAVIGLCLLACAMLLFETIGFNIVIAVVAAIASQELIHAVGVTKKNPLMAVFFGALSALIPLLYGMPGVDMVVYIFAFAGLLLLLVYHETLSFADYAASLVASWLLGMSFSTFIWIRNMDEALFVRLFYIVVIFGTAWLTDTCAYFVGCAIGKHKLAPKVSPKKTVEGAIGGIVGCVGLMTLIAWGFNALAPAIGYAGQINLLSVALIAFVLSLVGMLGDLTFSAIKRNYGIKDYGTIMPGHGGVLDRFDSVLFTAPVLMFVLQYVNLLG